MDRNTPFDGTLSLHTHAGFTFRAMRKPGLLPGLYQLVEIRMGTHLRVR